MTPTKHVRASTEPGPLGLLLWACTFVLAILCSVYALPWWVLLPIGCAVIFCAWGLAHMASECDPDGPCADCMVGQGTPSPHYDRECLLAVTARVPLDLVQEHCADCMVGQGRDCKCSDILVSVDSSKLDVGQLIASGAMEAPQVADRPPLLRRFWSWLTAPDRELN